MSDDLLKLAETCPEPKKLLCHRNGCRNARVNGWRSILNGEFTICWSCEDELVRFKDTLYFDLDRDEVESTIRSFLMTPPGTYDEIGPYVCPRDIYFWELTGLGPEVMEEDYD